MGDARWSPPRGVRGLPTLLLTAVACAAPGPPTEHAPIAATPGPAVLVVPGCEESALHWLAEDGAGGQVWDLRGVRLRTDARWRVTGTSAEAHSEALRSGARLGAGDWLFLDEARVYRAASPLGGLEELPLSGRMPRRALTGQRGGFAAEGQRWDGSGLRETNFGPFPVVRRGTVDGLGVALLPGGALLLRPRGVLEGRAVSPARPFLGGQILAGGVALFDHREGRGALLSGEGELRDLRYRRRCPEPRDVEQWLFRRHVSLGLRTRTRLPGPDGGTYLQVFDHEVWARPAAGGPVEVRGTLVGGDDCELVPASETVVFALCRNDRLLRSEDGARTFLPVRNRLALRLGEVAAIVDRQSSPPSVELHLPSGAHSLPLPTSTFPAGYCQGHVLLVNPSLSYSVLEMGSAAEQRRPIQPNPELPGVGLCLEDGSFALVPAPGYGHRQAWRIHPSGDARPIALPRGTAHVSFSSTRFGAAVNGAGQVFRTVDGGQHWIRLALPPATHVGCDRLGCWATRGLWSRLIPTAGQEAGPDDPRGATVERAPAARVRFPIALACQRGPLPEGAAPPDTPLELELRDGGTGREARWSGRDAAGDFVSRARFPFATGRARLLVGDRFHALVLLHPSADARALRDGDGEGPRVAHLRAGAGSRRVEPRGLDEPALGRLVWVEAWREDAGTFVLGWRLRQHDHASHVWYARVDRHGQVLADRLLAGVLRWGRRDGRIVPLATVAPLGLGHTAPVAYPLERHASPQPLQAFLPGDLALPPPCTTRQRTEGIAADVRVDDSYPPPLPGRTAAFLEVVQGDDGALCLAGLRVGDDPGELRLPLGPDGVFVGPARLDDGPAIEVSCRVRFYRGRRAPSLAAPPAPSPPP